MEVHAPAVPPEPPDPPDPPDPISSLVRYLLSEISNSPPLSLAQLVDLVVALSACSVTLSGLLVRVFMCFSDPFTALCSLVSGFSPALSSASRFDFAPLIYFPQISLICVSSLAGFVKRIGMLSGLDSESLLCTIALVFALAKVQICILGLPCYLNSSGSLIEYVALVTIGLGSLVPTFMASYGIFVALMRPLTAVCRFWSVFPLTVVAWMLFFPHLWQTGKKDYIICILIRNGIRSGFHSLIYSFMELILLPHLSLVLSDSFAGSFVWKEVFCFFNSFMGLYSDAQDSPSPVLQGFSFRYHDLLPW